MNKKEPFNLFDPKWIYELQMPTGGTRKITREELEKLSLNSPTDINEGTGNVTLISNYIGTFWTPFMKPGPFAVYFQLTKMAYGDKDHSYPSVPYLAMLTGTSEKSVQRYMKVLIDLNLVIVVELTDARTNEQHSNVYLVPTTVPRLPKPLLEKLPKRLQKEHEKYLEKLQTKRLITEEQFDYYYKEGEPK